MQQLSKPATSSDSFEIDFIDLMKLIFARKLIIVLTMLLFVGVTFIVLQVLPKYYMAEARIHISTSDESVQNALSEVEILKSNKIALRVISALSLYKDPMINAYVQRSDSQQLLKDFTSFDDQALAANPLVSLMLQNFSQNLFVKEIGGTDIIRIRFNHKDPQAANQITNAIIDSYQSLKTEQAEGRVLQGRQWLENKLQGLDSVMAAQREAAQNLRTAENISSTDDTKMLATDMSDLLKQQNQLRLVYAETYAKIQDMKAFQRSGKTMNADLSGSQILYNLKLSEQRLEEEIAGLAQRYGDKHPVIIDARTKLSSIKTAIRDEVRGVEQSLMSTLETTEAQINAIDKRIEEISQSRQTGAGALQSLSMIESGIEAQQNLYQDYVQKLADVEKDSALNGTGIEVLSYAAQPLKPFYPNYALSIGLAGLMGIFAGFGIVLLQDRLKNAFHSLPQLEQETELPVYGFSPKVRGLKNQNVAQYILSSAGTRAAEMIRSIRTLLKIKNIESPKIVMMTSSLPGEGKTTLSNWLGVLSARSGEKVIIVDCDFRRASLHKSFARSGNKTLVDYLSNNASIEDIIVRDNPGGVHTIFGKDVPQQALDLIDSKRMQALIESLGKAYDLVILDAPTVHSVSDALLLSKIADHVIYCVGWNKTSRDVVQTGLKKFRDIETKSLSLVMTKVDLEQASHYEGYDLQYYAF
ncbi:MAG: hypothetical protein CMH30_01005 [Micavibrio sp.]|nr:hypothetical protein [Micavibrio sp.]